jgi:hypothetical protein
MKPGLKLHADAPENTIHPIVIIDIIQVFGVPFIGTGIRCK